jgi:hypothetical protein
MAAASIVAVTVIAGGVLFALVGRGQPAGELPAAFAEKPAAAVMAAAPALTEEQAIAWLKLKNKIRQPGFHVAACRTPGGDWRMTPYGTLLWADGLGRMFCDEVVPNKALQGAEGTKRHLLEVIRRHEGTLRHYQQPPAGLQLTKPDLDAVRRDLAAAQTKLRVAEALIVEEQRKPPVIEAGLPRAIEHARKVAERPDVQAAAILDLFSGTSPRLVRWCLHDGKSVRESTEAPADLRRSLEAYLLSLQQHAGNL